MCGLMIILDLGETEAQQTCDICSIINWVIGLRSIDPVTSTLITDIWNIA